MPRPADSEGQPIVVLIGPAGCGKTTIGQLLADTLALPFLDGDDLHDPADRARMRSGHPLDDARRGPWLDRVRAALEQAAAAGSGLVAACSALKRAYRERLASTGCPLTFVELAVDPGRLHARLRSRHDHFFPPALLDDQLATLEPLPAAARVDATAPPEQVVRAIRRLLTQR